jgi:hypothetical protein
VSSGKVAPPGGMLAVHSAVVMAVHSTGSSAVVVAASVHWVTASEAVAVAPGI